MRNFADELVKCLQSNISILTFLDQFLCYFSVGRNVSNKVEVKTFYTRSYFYIINFITDKSVIDRLLMLASTVICVSLFYLRLIFSLCRKHTTFLYLP